MTCFYNLTPSKAMTVVLKGHFKTISFSIWSCILVDSWLRTSTHSRIYMHLASRLTYMYNITHVSPQDLKEQKHTSTCWGLYSMNSGNLRSFAMLWYSTVRPRNIMQKFTGIRKYKIDKYACRKRSPSINKCLQSYANTHISETNLHEVNTCDDWQDAVHLLSS